MPVQLPFTAFLNHYFAGVANAVAGAVSCAPQVSAAAHRQRLCHGDRWSSWCCLLFFVLVRVTLSVDKPGPAQHIAEMLHGLVSEQAESIIGHGYERFVPLRYRRLPLHSAVQSAGTVARLYLADGEALGAAGCRDPDLPVLPVPGLRAKRVVGYIKQFLGPIWWIAP